MKKLFKRISAIMLTGMILFSAAFSGSSQDAAAATTTKWKKACKAYKTYLAKNQSHFKAAEFDFSTKNKESYQKADCFLVIDLDKNGVPELIVKHPIAYKDDEIYVYTYKKGKVVQIKDTNGKKGKAASINISCQANGRYTVYKCKKNHLHVDYFGYMEIKDCTYVVKGDRLKLLASSKEYRFTDIPMEYTINGKASNSDAYQALIKKCGTDDYKKLKYLNDNTSQNRKKIK